MMITTIIRRIGAKLSKRSYLTLTVAVIISSVLVALPDRISALEFQCELPGDIRYLKVDIPGKENLCEVSVKYEYNGESKVMWYAQNDSTFCTARAYELRDKYEDTWKYTCSTRPDRDGIDKLSPSQRSILDRQLKALIERGQNSDTPYGVTAVKAEASTPLYDAQALLAFQFFLDNGKDYTEIILDTGESWELIATLGQLVEQIDSDANITSALIHAIGETGALEIHTTVSEGADHDCLGSQTVNISPDGVVSTRAMHQYVCHESIAKR